METIVVELTNPKAINLLLVLEELHIIKLRPDRDPSEQSLSAKYRGILTRKGGKKLKKHVDQMRKEWDNT